MINRTLYALILITGLLCPDLLSAQDPIHWAWTAQKVSDKEYEVRLTATIDEGWHLYSMKQPEDAIAIPTEILFNKNPLVELRDKIKEDGQLEKYRDATLDIEAWQYAKEVVYTQRIRLKAKVKTSFSGSVEYQACTDEKCLPPKKIAFSIDIK